MAAPLAYFDTSVVLKRYVREAGSTMAERLLRHHELVSSALLVVEIVSALRRRRDDFEPDGLEATWRRLGEDRTRWRLAAVSEPLLARAEGVVRSAGLRTLDAIHVATALIVGEQLAGFVAFITADALQAAVARDLGLAVVVVK